MTDEKKGVFPPVPPNGMTLIFHYKCPLCGQNLPMAEPTEPGQVRCMNCGTRFPIIPVDRCTVDYVHLMTDDGRAAADPDFV